MPKNPMSKTDADPKADLALTRERLSELALQYPDASSAVSRAAAAAEAAKVEVDLRPGDRAARAAAQDADQALEAAIRERDAITEAIERLRRHEAALAAEVAAETSVELVAAQAAARAANAEAIGAGAAAVRAWTARIILDSELAGRQGANIGLLMSEYLQGRFEHSAMSAGFQDGIGAVRAEARRMREQLERGEVIP